MDWGAFVGPAVVAAVVSGAISIVSMLVQRGTSLRLHREKLDFDKNLAERKTNADMALAERKFEFDRNLIDWKRRTEIAEQTLADFYKVKELFRSSRQPFAFAGEGRSRPRAETDEDHSKDAIYAPFERLNKEFAFLSELHARRFRFMTLFGTKTDEPFNIITLSYNELQYATFSLLNMKGLSGDLREQFESTIGWVLDKKDPFQERIGAAVSEIEALCRPVLEVRLK